MDFEGKITLKLKRDKWTTIERTDQRRKGL